MTGAALRLQQAVERAEGAAESYSKALATRARLRLAGGEALQEVVDAARDYERAVAEVNAAASEFVSRADRRRRERKPTRRPARTRPTAVPRTYSLFSEISASATEPVPLHWRTHQLTKMWAGLASLERAPEPSKDDWRCCSDAVNLLERLVHMGVLEDPANLIGDAVEALAIAGERHLATGAPLRLSGAGMQAVRGVLEDYASALAVLPARTMYRAHRLTEARIREVMAPGLRAGVTLI